MHLDFGHFSLVAAWLTAFYASGASFFGAFFCHRMASFTEIATEDICSEGSECKSGAGGVAICSAIRALAVSGIFSLLALLSLGVSFITGDFRYLYVWQHSNSAMSLAYRFAAIWGGMDGSMLLWATLLSGVGVVSTGGILNANTQRSRLFNRWFVFFLSITSVYFLAIVLFYTNPFRFISVNQLPVDGNGLNPLLQNPSMLIHPPILYLGFTTLVVPFGYALAALASGQIEGYWLQRTRPWALTSWISLTSGIVLGGNWAYIELGWGGFWAWDPVENASFLPWLLLTAFLHSSLVQDKRGMLKGWTIFLAISSYLLVVFGTFLTRSGIVQSVHAFGESDIGWVFLLFIVSISALTVFLFWKRRGSLVADNRLESWLSREGAFMINNFLFLAITFIIIWGVMLPVISQAVMGQQIVVGQSFFNQATGPLFLALLFLMGVAPFLGWRLSNFGQIKRLAMRPFLIASGVSLLTVLVDIVFFRQHWSINMSPEGNQSLGILGRFYLAIGFGLITFTVLAFSSGIKHLSKVEGEEPGPTILNLAGSSRRLRRLGAMITHLGIAIMAFSIIASVAYKIEKDMVLGIGEQRDIGDLVLELESIETGQGENYLPLVATLLIKEKDDDKLVGRLTPESRFFPVSRQITAEVDLRISVLRDVYVAFAGLSEDVNWNDAQAVRNAKGVFKVFINPFQVWLWVGTIVTLLGAVLVFLAVRKSSLNRDLSLESPGGN